MSYRNKKTVNADLSQPWLSIVVPVYNDERFLASAWMPLRNRRLQISKSFLSMMGQLTDHPLSAKNML